MLELILIGALYLLSLIAFRVIAGFQAASDAMQGWGAGHVQVMR